MLTTITGNGCSHKLSVRDDFSFTPGSRYVGEGEFSGEEFRRNHLKPAIELAIRDNFKLLIELDGTAGYGTSFLEEAFGGLIREDRIGYEAINTHIELVSLEEPYLIEDINQYLSDANTAKSG